MRTLDVRTSEREQMLDITREVADAVSATGVADGVVVVYVPHTTAAVTINENADPDVCADVLCGLRDIAPRSGKWRHGEGNSDGHIKSSLVGCSVTIPVSGGRLVLGTWQGIQFCEFDGPRNRCVYVQVLGA
ncbi:MAG: hypothetical protein C0418_00165 [Coriobacteriaceae bacterium]|nr:hypothetical protein [Coriobacteriaceae bacterium]